MVVKGKTRKDKRGYALYTGECQRESGLYEYSCMVNGKRYTISAKTLAELRRLEEPIKKAKEMRKDFSKVRGLTLNQVFDRYFADKNELKPSTRGNYKYMYDHYVRDALGKVEIEAIDSKRVKDFYLKLVKEDGLSRNTVENIHTLLHPAFDLAIEEGIICKNPTEVPYKQVRKSSYGRREKKHPLTVEQQKALTEFVVNNRSYYGWKPMIFVLLGTGLRIGECLGLRWDDIDLDKRTLTVDHAFSNKPDEEGKCARHIQPFPKTWAGFRTIPLVQEVVDALIEELEIQRSLGYKSETLDGYTNFIFTTRDGNIISPSSVEKAFKEIMRKFNEQGEVEGKEMVSLPSYFAPHVLRYTFCTRLCECETNLKAIQYICGHKTIQTTMDLYAEATTRKNREVMENMEGKIFS